jgi:tRNA nucleotidyltransferase (CCA-adding enzyme)
MAWSPTRGLADPFGGAEDLKNGILRAVGTPSLRFSEDALRILRGVRFAVRYQLTPEAETEQAMNDLAPLMDSLARERVFDELCKLLPLVNAQDLSRYSHILGQVIPGLKPLMGFAQHSRFHAYDIYTHTAHAVAAAPRELTLRWAALLHDIGKPGCFTLDEAGEGHFYSHAQESARLADEILHQLKAPTVLRERVVLLIEKHMTPLQPDRKLLRRRLSQYGEEAVWQLLQLQKADYTATGKIGDAPDYAAVEALLSQLLLEQPPMTVKDLAISGHDVMALGYSGPAVGQAMNWLLDQVLEEKIPNQRQALLDALYRR